MKLYDLLKILGILSFIFLLLTFIFGFFKLKIKNRIVFHKWLAIITLVLAFLHAILVVYLTYF